MFVINLSPICDVVKNFSPDRNRCNIYLGVCMPVKFYSELFLHLVFTLCLFVNGKLPNAEKTPGSAQCEQLKP